jgi:hypothetical protein
MCGKDGGPDAGAEGTGCRGGSSGMGSRMGTCKELHRARAQELRPKSEQTPRPERDGDRARELRRARARPQELSTKKHMFFRKWKSSGLLHRTSFGSIAKSRIKEK